MIKRTEGFKPFIHFGVCFLILISVLSGSAVANDDYIKLRPDVSDPSEIPDFSNFEAPGIEPGTVGTLKFTIKNRYEFNDDNNMTNVSLLVNIYLLYTLEDEGQSSVGVSFDRTRQYRLN
jgi:hypothetical protein